MKEGQFTQVWSDRKKDDEKINHLKVEVQNYKENNTR